MRPLVVVAGLLTLSSLLGAQTTPPPPEQGRIVGTVVNDVGEPVGGTIICDGSYCPRGGSSSCGNRVDQRGQFDIPVPFETNRISAGKPAAGYWGGDLEKSGQVVKLGPQQPTINTVLNLGARPARLGLSVDVKGSGQSQQSFKVRLFVIDEHPFFRSIEIDNKNTIPIPADKDVMLIVQAPGYKRWFFKDAANAEQPTLRLQSGEQRTIDAELEPESTQN